MEVKGTGLEIKPTRSYRSRASWRELVSRYESSGQEADEFCLAEGLKYPRFMSWVSKFSRERVAGHKGCNVKELPGGLRGLGQEAEYSLELGNGLTLRMPLDFEETSLKRLISLLMG